MAIAAKVLIDAIARLNNTVTPAVGRVLGNIANNAESSMAPDRLVAAKNLFEDKIKPHYQLQFKATSIDAIFAKIKESILEEIIVSSNVEISSWVKQNKSALLNNDHTILAESRNRLRSMTNFAEVAWRNFDSETRICGYPDAMWGSNFFVGDAKDAEVRERLAYYYLAIIDEKAVPDPEKRKQLLENFVRILSNIRRKNADMNRDDDLDIPSCRPGTFGRLADIGQGHPIAQLWFTIELALPPFVSVRSVERLKQLFLNCKTNKEREEIIKNLQKPLQNFLDADLQKRNEILKVLGVEYSAGSYKLSSDLVEGNRIISGWISTVESQMPHGKILYEIHKEQILLMLLDPMPYFGNEILKTYNSLESIEENAYEVPPGADFLDHYIAYLKHERAAAARQEKKMARVAFLAEFSPEKITERMIQVSIKAGFHGRDRSEIGKAIARIETTDLLKNYTKKFIEHKNKVGAAFNYLVCRKEVITALLAEGIDFRLLGEEAQEARIRILEAKIKELQAVQKQQPRRYQQLDPEYLLNIAAIAYENFGVESERGARDDVSRATINVPKTGPEGANGPYGVTMALPRLPVIHPYNPNGEDLQMRNDVGGVPAFIMTIAFPIETHNHLPAGIRALLQQHNVSIENLEIFFCAQDMPWKNVPLLLRPHPWLHSDAPVIGDYNRSSTILAGVSDIYGCTTPLATVDISTHGPGNIVYSPNNLTIEGVQDYNKSHAFYSFCIDATTKKAVLTLHWLLNDQDFMKAKDFYPDLTDYIRSLTNFHNVELVAALEALLDGNQPTPQGAKRYYLQEQQASLSLQVTADIPLSELKCIENSIRSLIVTNYYSVPLLSLLETEHARLSASPAEKKKLKAKEKAQLPEPVHQVPQTPQEQAGPSRTPVVFSRDAHIIVAPITAQTPQSDDDRILSELVREAESLRAQNKRVYYVYENHKITVTETQPKGFFGRSFDLSDESSGKNQMIHLQMKDFAVFYGDHGFIHRATQETLKGLGERVTLRYKEVYAASPEKLQKASLVGSPAFL